MQRKKIGEVELETKPLTNNKVLYLKNGSMLARRRETKSSIANGTGSHHVLCTHNTLTPIHPWSVFSIVPTLHMVPLFYLPKNSP